MGDFQPDDHVNGSCGCSLIALICNSFPATCDAIACFMTIPQNYTIFSNTNRLVLTNYPNIPLFDGDLQDVVNKFEKGNIEETLINVADLEQGLSQVKACYAEVIFAAGGLVKTPDGKLLCINRLGRWDLPKGKVEDGETMDIAALREVEEETGLQHITLGPLLIKTFHTYPLKGKQVFKETHWYAMTAPEQPLTAQAEEDITQALWITPAELPQILADTYGNIKLVIEAGERKA